MDGVSGYEGWRWIFILEGIVTVIVAVASFWMLYDYPDTAKFLTTSERKVLQARLLLDNDGCSHEYKRRSHARLHLLHLLSYFDCQSWLHCRHRSTCELPSPCLKTVG
jgi:hypothetical protein